MYKTGRAFLVLEVRGVRARSARISIISLFHISIMFKIFCTDEAALYKFIEGTEVSKPVMSAVLDSYSVYHLTKAKFLVLLTTQKIQANQLTKILKTKGETKLTLLCLQLLFIVVFR